MKNNPRVRFLPIVMLPAIIPAILMPAMRHHLPDSLLGGMMGISIGLAIVATVWMAKGARHCSNDG